jgi:hypothetical protein
MSMAILVVVVRISIVRVSAVRVVGVSSRPGRSQGLTPTVAAVFEAVVVAWPFVRPVKDDAERLADSFAGSLTDGPSNRGTDFSRQPLQCGVQSFQLSGHEAADLPKGRRE